MLLRHRLLVAPAALALLLAACGDDDDTVSIDDASEVSPAGDDGTDGDEIDDDASTDDEVPDDVPTDDELSGEGGFDEIPEHSEDVYGEPHGGETDGFDGDGEGDIEYGRFETLSPEPGGEPVVVEGNIVRAEPRDAFLIDAPGGAGEQLYLTVTSLEDNASVFVYGPDGEVVPGGADVMEATIDLGEPGAYLIEVGPTRGNTTYELSVGISVPAD